MAQAAIHPRKLIELAYDDGKRLALERYDKGNWHGTLGVMTTIAGPNLSNIRKPIEEIIVPARAAG